jgi:predicted amidohydrolase YtcJ
MATTTTTTTPRAVVAALAVLLSAVALAAQSKAPADLVLLGRAYTLAWPDPTPDGTPSPKAPFAGGTWHPDAEAIAIRGDRIVFAGTAAEAKSYTGPRTKTITAPAGGAILPGLVDAHVHAFELGASLERVNLVGVKTEAEAVDRVAARARTAPRGEWIVGWGWDEGAWANHYPDMRLLSERVPDHPVYLRGLHSFAVWGNRLAFERANITPSTSAPAGGEIKKDEKGQPTGILMNNAARLLESAVPAPTPAQLKARVLAGLKTLAAAGYVTVHEAGADTAQMDALESLAAEGALPVRVYAMLAGRDQPLLDRWLARGFDRDASAMLVTRSVKAFYDGALGSRGALLLADYSDRAGHRGQRDATFHPESLAKMLKAGFQLSIHAIGDAANREAMDFIQQNSGGFPGSLGLRERIEHAQVLAPEDIPRLSRLGIIASMQPSHAVEDMPWAEARVGRDRIGGAYAWRTIRQAGGRLVFSSDLPGTDYSVFYGLHSAVTRQDKAGKPEGGWRPDQRVTAEEALRGFTTWAAYTAFRENVTGTLAPGRWADVTIVSVDPFTAAPSALLGGRVQTTIVGGRIVHGG